MSNFSVASVSTANECYNSGQSFTPNVAGPNGSGSPGTASSVALLSIIVGYPTSATTYRSVEVYVYSAPLDDPTDAGTLTNLVATSVNTIDASELGSGSFTRKFLFPTNVRLTPSAMYYIYFQYAQYVCVADSNVYSGGSLYDMGGDPQDDAAQFQVNMST